LPFFSRFEGPVSLRVTGAAPAHLGADLDAVLHRLRTEAGIAIARTDAENANITIQAVSRAEIQKTCRKPPVLWCQTSATFPNTPAQGAPNAPIGRA
jgi:hypothetical protein